MLLAHSQFHHSRDDAKHSDYFDFEYYRADKLGWYIYSISSTDTKGQLSSSAQLDHAVLFGMLSDPLSLDHSKMTRIDERIGRTLADIASLDVMIQNIGMHRPLPAYNKEELDILTVEAFDRDTAIRYRPREVSLTVGDPTQILDNFCATGLLHIMKKKQFPIRNA